MHIRNYPAYSSTRIRFSQVGYLKARRVKINSPKQIAQVFSHIRYYDRERLICVSLNKNRRIIGYEIVSVGNLSFSLVHPREVLKLPLLMGARYIAIVHNHPSGDPTLSRVDMAVARRLALAAKIFNIKLLYSVVVGVSEYCACVSGRDDGSNMKICRGAVNDQKDKFVSDCIKKYEILLKDGIDQSNPKILSSDSALRYVKSLLKKMDKNNGNVVIYTDDTSRLIKHCLYNMDKTSFVSNVLLESIFLNAARFIVVITNRNSVGWEGFYKKDIFKRILVESKILGIELADILFV